MQLLKAFSLLGIIVLLGGSGVSNAQEPQQEQVQRAQNFLWQAQQRQASRAHTYWTLAAANQCQSCHQTAHAHGYIFGWAANMTSNTLGIEVAPVGDELRAHMQLKLDGGVLLSAVPDESEGAKLGLKTHDVVVKVDDQPVADAARFNDLMANASGKTARLAIIRQGKPSEIAILVPSFALANLAASSVAASEAPYRIGVTLSAADDTLRSHLRLAAGEGLVVTDVVKESPAETSGIKLHDVLVQLDGQRLNTVEATNAQIQEIKDRTVEIRLLRAGQELALEIQPAKSPSEIANPDLHLRALLSANLQTGSFAPADPHRVFLYHAHPTAGQTEASATSAGDAAAQLAELRKQLTELHKTVDQLEALIGKTATAEPAAENQPQP